MKKGILFVILALAALFAVACGGGAPAEPEQQEITLNFEGYDEFRFSPDDASVPAGSIVNVTLENVGSLQHNWILVNKTDDMDLASISEADAISGANAGVIEAGESGSVSFIAPSAGTYLMVCTIPGHAVGGMIGDFEVTP